MKTSKLVKLIFYSVAISLSGCGGGGGGGSGGSNSTPVAGSAPALASSDNSYRNFKQSARPANALLGLPDTRAYADFSGNGRVDTFAAALTYSPGTSTPQTATGSYFSFWREEPGGSIVEDQSMISSNEGCIHPRKALVADFNKDGRPDVFVVCHGYDAPPFPGEKNKIVLSQPTGPYLVSDASNDIGFFHGGAAADLNADGYPDVILVNNLDPSGALVLLNQGNGTFARESGVRLPTTIGFKNYFSAELLDVNGDGVLDLALGGHEWEGATTQVFINPGNNVFNAVTPIVIPAVPGDGVVLDFTVTGSGTGRTLWVLRSSGGDGTFYESRVVQKVVLDTLASTIVLNDRPAQWIRWLIPTTVSGNNVIVSDDPADNVSIPQ